MMATTIPSQYYVAIQYRKDASTESGLLGFASPYTKDAAFEKRKSTQDSWAYGGYGTQFVIEEDGSIIPGPDAKYDAMVLFTTKCYPIIIDNIPLAGFEVAKSVRRYGSWGGGGNVVWRIADPRGFELEIGSENFACIIDCATLVNGVIQGECVWGREGAKNVLLPVVSEPYQEAVKLTLKKNIKISLKDVKIGDTVEILSTKVLADDLVCQYLGKYYFLEPEQLGSGDKYNYSGKFRFTHQTDKYLLKSIKTGKYFVLSTPKVVNIVAPIAVPLDKVAVAKEVTDKIDTDFKIEDAENTILVSATKIDNDQIVTKLTPYPGDISDGVWPKTGKYGSEVETIVCKVDDGYCVASNKYVDGEYKTAATMIDVSQFGTNLLSVKKEKHTPDTTYWNSRHYGERWGNIERTDVDPNTVAKYRIEVTVGDLVGKVIRLGYF
jgi:hypothetical protein